MATAEEMGSATFDIEQAKAWITKMGERGSYAPTSARLRATAIERLAGGLTEEEPRTVAYLLEGLDELTDRYMRKENGNRETAVTYRSRAKVALEDFLAFQADPTGWRPRSRAESTKKPRTGDLKVVDAEEGEPEEAPTPAAPEARQGLDRCLLGEGVEFLYRIPDRGLEVKDVLRIALNLLSQTHDFDPTDQTQRSLFALARGEK